ncbi:MAG: hypothetical protein KHX13_02145 [Acidaminococcus intestini]|uniref:Uncharacterized protein n=1 Tax=Acidaminococcus intestini TaxID=187327 RepID=A0A943I3R5_9FIRM|nr:hypothetical protein [Acidaminococcus intestini]
MNGVMLLFAETLKALHPERGRKGRILLRPFPDSLQIITVTKGGTLVSR